MGALYVSHYLWVIFAFQVVGGSTAARQPLRTAGGGTTGAGTGQHSYLPRADGPRRASDGPVCGDFMGRNFHPGATGIFRIVPVALAAAGLSAEERNKT